MRAGATFSSAAALQAALYESHYLATEGLSTALFLALRLGKPLLLEGIAGCGKTEIARTLAPLLGTQLIRLQCYEGISTAEALYDWDYSRQLLHLRSLSAEDSNQATTSNSGDLYSRRFLLERPLLAAIQAPTPPVLLLDEFDRADPDFEAFLLEFLEEFQVSIPELGTIRAAQPPIVVLTSNRTRELHDALKRRCIYHWMDLPSAEVEEQIIRLRVPEASNHLARQVAETLAAMRRLDLAKQPGASEAVDWARALTLLAAQDPPTRDDLKATLSVVIKDPHDYAPALACLGDSAASN